MPFNAEEFMSQPTVEEFEVLKKDELLALGLHLQLNVKSTTRKAEIREIVCKYLVDEGKLPESALQPSISTKTHDVMQAEQLAYLERKEEREFQLRIRELEARERERELEKEEKERDRQLQIRLKEMELKANSESEKRPERKSDASKNIRLVHLFKTQILMLFAVSKGC